MTNVLSLNGKKVTKEEVQQEPINIPNELLAQAKDKYKNVMILGFTDNGELLHMTSSNLSNSQALWLVESFKNRLFNTKG